MAFSRVTDFRSKQLAAVLLAVNGPWDGGILRGWKYRVYPGNEQWRRDNMKAVGMGTPLERLNSMQLCMRYGISYQSLDNWKQREGFPRDAGIRTKEGLMWEVSRVDLWLRSRKVVRGRRPRWLEVVGHPAANVGA